MCGLSNRTPYAADRMWTESYGDAAKASFKYEFDLLEPSGGRGPIDLRAGEP
jgi:hypothetical protein